MTVLFCIIWRIYINKYGANKITLTFFHLYEYKLHSSIYLSSSESWIELIFPFSERDLGGIWSPICHFSSNIWDGSQIGDCSLSDRTSVRSWSELLLLHPERRNNEKCSTQSDSRRLIRLRSAGFTLYSCSCSPWSCRSRWTNTIHQGVGARGEKNSMKKIQCRF